MIRSWLAAALGSIFLAGSSTGAGMPHNDKIPMREHPASTTREIGGRIASSTRGLTTVDIPCVATAVAARESALSAAASAETQTIATAYATRAAALNSAYTGTDPKTVKTNVKSAWDAFATSTKNAKLTWQRVKENTWKTFRTAAKACKGSESVVDSSSASMEQ